MKQSEFLEFWDLLKAREKKRAHKVWLLLVLHAIGWKTDARFSKASH